VVSNFLPESLKDIMSILLILSKKKNAFTNSQKHPCVPVAKIKKRMTISSIQASLLSSFPALSIQN